VVVEEILGDQVALSTSPWPGIDEKGRLIFSGPASTRTVERRALEVTLRKRRRMGGAERLRPEELEAAKSRRVAVGDVYASSVRGQPEATSPDDLLGKEVIDVTAEAREAAQASFLAAVTTPLSAAEVDRLLDVRDEQSG